jgi:LemA protein
MIALLLTAAAVIVGAILVFNRLVRERNRVRAAWSDIDVQLTRRHDLIPQLVEAVKAYSDYEKATLLAVTELRGRSDRGRSAQTYRACRVLPRSEGQ